MKTPIDVVKGKIVSYDEQTGEVTIKAVYQDWLTMVKRGYRSCLVQLLDGRPISDKQRKTCYKLIREIANFTGMDIDRAKEGLKQKFLNEELQADIVEDFSLSDAPMSLVCAFERYLVRFLLEWDIPTSFPLLDFVDDVQDFLYGCLVTRKCCVCGDPSDLHHVDQVGMGRNRDEIVHEGMEVLPLCRLHHTEAHNMGKSRFRAKYHIDKGIVLDGELCKILNLNWRETEDEFAEEDAYGDDL